jgi:hypothetical protein
MAFTGRLGTDESQPGNIQPGAEGSWSDDGGYQSDAFQNDAFQLGAGNQRTATDAVTVSESASRAGSFSRPTTDAPVASDSAVRSQASSRTATDAPTTSDSAVAVVTVVRTATEAVATSESATRAVALSRTTTDAPSTSESAAASGGAAASAFQTDAFQDSPAFQTEAGSVTTDSVTTSESATRSGSFSRFTADGPTVSESVAATADAYEAVDSVSATDTAVATLSGYHRTVTDDVSVTVSLTDDFTRTEASSWGTGAIGTWSTDGGTTVSVDGDEAVSVGSAFMYQTVPLPAVAVTTDVRTISTQFLAPSSGDTAIGIELIDGSDFIAVYFSENASLADELAITTANEDDSTTVTFTRNLPGILKVEFNRTNGGISAKVWNAANAEPDWQLIVVDPLMIGVDLATLAIARDSTTSTTTKWDWVEVQAGTGALAGGDTVTRTLVASRGLTEDLDTVDWIVSSGTTTTPVYGQDPNGYQPELAAPIDDNDTTITVTRPLPAGTDLPILVYINGEYVLVTAVSLDGLTWTVVRGQNGSTAAGHGSFSPILPANTTISVGGLQIGADVIYNRTRLTTYANGKVGTGEIWVRDVERTRSFTTGAEVVVRHRNVRIWGGYVVNIKRSYPFPGGTGDPTDEPRYLILEVVDYNILLQKRIYHDKDTPTHMKVKQWPNGTADDLVIGHMLAHFLNIGGDGLSFDLHHVGTPGLHVESCDPNHTDYFQIAWAGYTWGDAMRAIANETGAIYYIDPDKVFRYVDDSTKQTAFGYSGLSDAPGGTVIGYRDFELSHDGSKLVNEQFTWGVGQGATAPVLGHKSDEGSITEHGLWQQAELRYDMYCQGTVDLRADTWLHGSPQNRRGHKSDKVAARATVFVPYFRVADVISLESTTFDIDLLAIPVRGSEITFPTPWDIQNVLTISHEKDTPWEAFEFAFPDFDLDFRIPDFDFGIGGGFPTNDPCEDFVPNCEPCDPGSWGSFFPFWSVDSDDSTLTQDPDPGDNPALIIGLPEDLNVFHSGGGNANSFYVMEAWVATGCNDMVESHVRGSLTITGDATTEGPLYRPTNQFGWENLPSWFSNNGVQYQKADSHLSYSDNGLGADGGTFFTFDLGTPSSPVGQFTHDTWTQGVFRTELRYYEGEGRDKWYADYPARINAVFDQWVWIEEGSNIPGPTPGGPATRLETRSWNTGATSPNTIPFEYHFIPNETLTALEARLTIGGVTLTIPSVTNPATLIPRITCFRTPGGRNTFPVDQRPDIGIGELEVRVQIDSAGTGPPTDCVEGGGNCLTFESSPVNEASLPEIHDDPIPVGGFITNGTSTGIVGYTPALTVAPDEVVPFGWVSSTSIETGLSATEPFFMNGTINTASTWTGDGWGLTGSGNEGVGFNVVSGSNTYPLARWYANENRIEDGEMLLFVYGEDKTQLGFAPWSIPTQATLNLFANTTSYSIDWDGTTLSFTVGGITGIYTVAGRLANGVTGFGVKQNVQNPGGGAATVPSVTTTLTMISDIDCSPCADAAPGELADPPDDGTLYGEVPLGCVLLENGNYVCTFRQQFLPSSTEVWADSLRLRLTEDYTEHPENAAIEIHADAQVGFTTFDPGMSIVANMVPFVHHHPPPEYVEP